MNVKDNGIIKKIVNRFDFNAEYMVMESIKIIELLKFAKFKELVHTEFNRDDFVLSERVDIMRFLDVLLSTLGCR